MSNHDFEVEVLVRGRPIKVFKHKGDFYVEGRKGSAYELKIYNNTWKQVEVVPSVDGMSVMEDGPAGPQNSGYLVPARSSIVIPGFRRNNSAVAEFMFAGKQNSYANAMGEGTQNVGVIGFMFFKEKEVYQPPYEPWNNIMIGSSAGGMTFNSCNTMGSTLRHTSDAPTKGSRRIRPDAESVNVVSTSDSFELGTDWGNEVTHNVQEVQFTRDNPDHPDKIITIYYDSKRGLESRGIQVVAPTVKPKYQSPNPFPGYTETGCTPPPRWRRK